MFKNNLIYRFATKSFDLAIIGGGPGGYVAAIKAAQSGLSTVCIQKRGALGGTCYNVGCIPSKALLNISQKYWQASKLYHKLGIQIPKPILNWSKVQQSKNMVVSSMNKQIQQLFLKNKVNYMKGNASLTSPSSIEVTSLQGNKQIIQAQNIIIATGSQAGQLKGLQIDQKIILSSTGALALKKVPEEMIVVGAGYIGLEIASIYARFGTRVTVVQEMDEIIPTMDREIAKNFHSLLKKQGLNIVTSHKVVSGLNHGSYAQIIIEPTNGGTQKSFKADHILVATHRTPNTKNLDLQKIGVKIDQKGYIVVNHNLQTIVPHIYAIGDCIGGLILAQKAQQQGLWVIDNLLHKPSFLQYTSMPTIIYTHPQVACVGSNQQQLQQKKIQYSKGVFPFIANSRAKVVMDTDGMVKVLVEKYTDRILGVHILGPGAGEMISQAVIGIRFGATSQDLARTCHAHPTLSEAFKQACMAAHHKAIHI